MRHNDFLKKKKIPATSKYKIEKANELEWVIALIIVALTSGHSYQVGQPWLEPIQLSLPQLLCVG